MIARVLLVASLFTSSASLAIARDRQVGNIVYDPPKHWAVSDIRDEGWVTLSNDRKDERCRFCSIRIHVGAPAKGNFKVWVRGRMKVALEDADVIKTMPTKTVQDRRMGTVHTYARTIKDRGDEMQIFMAFDLGDRWEMVHFEGDADDRDELTESAAALKEEFFPMATRLKFISKGAKPVIGKPVPGELDGVWFGSRIDYGMNFDATMRVDVNPVIFTFWPDGRFFEGVPDSGVSAFDHQSAALTQTSETGNYILKEKDVRLFYADGKVDTLEREGDEFRDGNATLSRVRIADKGYRFKGNLHNFAYHPFAPGISGGVATSNDWIFYEDGTYTSDRFVGASGAFDGGGGFATSSDAAKKRGRYEIANGLIRLTPPEGDEILWPFFLQQHEGAFRPIVRGEYLKDEKGE